MFTSKAKAVKAVKCAVGFAGIYVTSGMFYTAAMETGAHSLLIMSGGCFALGLLMLADWLD